MPDAIAYFNYNGTSQNYLDEELLKSALTEDSLVLLYRTNENSDWLIINTPSEATYQPGGNLKDKLGRFWLTKLLPGDYAFGIRDQSVVGLKLNTKDTGLNLMPNPVDDVLTMALPNYEIFSNACILVSDTKGIEVIKTDINTHQNSYLLNVKKLKSGMYYLVIENNKKRYTARFIKS